MKNKDIELKLKKQRLGKLYKKLGSISAVAMETGMSISGVYRHIKSIIKRKKQQKMSCFVTTPAIDAVVNLSYRLEKFKIRKWIVDTADAMLDNISAITLPGTEWIMERDLFLKCEGKVKKITALEKDPNLHAFSMHNIPPVNGKVEFLCKADSDLFSSASSEPYNLLWLDYMGPFFQNRLESFENALKNGYVSDKSMVCLTFLNGRDGSMTKLYESHSDKTVPVGKGRYNNARLMIIPQMYADAAAPYGFATSVLSAYMYKERQGGTPMSPMLFIALLMEKQVTDRQKRRRK